MSGAGRVTEGSPEPLGVRLTAEGVNVAVYSADATVMAFCLFGAGDVETARLFLPGRTGPVFHGHIAGLGPGVRYGLRAYGPFDPARGLRFNPNKLLLDPYALQLDRPFSLSPALFGYRPDTPEGGASFDETDSAPFMPKGVVLAPTPPPPPSPSILWGEMVIYELHVRGFTRTRPEIPEPLRGTFAGLAHPAAIGHLRKLGVTTVELLPAMAWVDERHLPPLGLSNYWGYNPVAFLAPDPRLAPGGWAEVRAATEALAAAGIETVLDVVLNHSGEGDALGPTLSLRGLDNKAYYRLRPDDPALYVDDAGTGNVLALDRPAALRLAMDSLRAWRRLGGVSGFRFDLATVLGRRAEGFDPGAPLLAAIGQDPELRTLKLIAEPWDCGSDGYQLGRFPPAWGEWNDKFRDVARGFWRGERVSLGQAAKRLSGSQDLLPGKSPSRSINFVVAHDGFTLADLVSYAAKHNDANGEQGRDGADDNRSWNNGAEGDSDDPTILAARLNDQRALLATLILARGTPMLAMGAELGHSQHGNNNAYAQDNATGWLDWSKADRHLLEFATRLIAARRAHPALRADRFLTGEPQGQAVYPDVVWRRPDGGALQPADWDDPNGETLVMALAQSEGEGLDRAILVLHRGRAATPLILPDARDGFAWTVLADSANPERSGVVDDDALTLSPRSVLLLGETPAPDRPRRGVEPDVLRRLASAAGIGLQWWSVDGQDHTVTPDTLRALLAAMQLPAWSTQQALSSLRQLAEAHDRRPLASALTGRTGQPVRIEVRFDPGEPPPRTWLTIEGEDGRELRLGVSPETCAEVVVAGRDGRSSRALIVMTPALPAGRCLVTREDRPDNPGHLTVAPPSCHLPQALRGQRRLFGLSAQLYSIRRAGDQGIGDFATLGALADASAAQGAAMLCLNPLHALFPDRRERTSPYYPSDRRFLDPIYLDLERLRAPGDWRTAAAGMSNLAVVDYARVWALKLEALQATFAAKPPGPAFADFIAAGGDALQQFAVFQTIAETRPAEPWQVWPAELRDPASPGVQAFAESHREHVRFHQYLQWLSERQLAEAARRAQRLQLGLCRDLAVGAARDGAEAWAYARLMAQGVSIGAPPDRLGPQGQVWGLPPFDPHRLTADGFGALSQLFAANMRYAAALRIDHVMGLARQFWVPEGADGSEGAYVAFSLQAILGELALESQRAHCLVIGEDLGTVPKGLRETLSEAAVLRYCVLPFERDGSRFRPPQAYPSLAMACVSTHDLPTLAGWWTGSDIAERLQLDLIDVAKADAARDERLADKHALLRALAEAGLIEARDAAEGPLSPELAAAIHAFIAETPALLALAQVEDLAGEESAVNVPGTDRQRANWRRRIARPLEILFEAEPAKSILVALRVDRSTD